VAAFAVDDEIVTVGLRGRSRAATGRSTARACPPAAGRRANFRSEMQARIASFKKHQERFERERRNIVRRP